MYVNPGFRVSVTLRRTSLPLKVTLACTVASPSDDPPPGVRSSRRNAAWRSWSVTPALSVAM